MKQIKASEAVEQLAEKVMGWTYNEPHYKNHNCSWWSKNDLWVVDVGDWNPLADANHRDMVLEEWRGVDHKTRWFRICDVYNGNIRVTLYVDPISKRPCYADVEHKSLNYAVCQAILSSECEEGIQIIEETD